MNIPSLQPKTTFHISTGVEKKPPLTQEEPPKRDSLLLTDEARQRFGQSNQWVNERLEQLEERKREIMEERSDFQEKALENGQSIDDMKYELEEFDDQLLAIEKEMVALQQAEFEKKEREREKELQEKIAEATDDQMHAYIQFGQTLEHQQSIKRVQALAKVELGWLREASQKDAGRGFSMENTTRRIVELESSIAKMETMASQQVGKVNEQMQQVNKVQDEKENELEDEV